MRKRFLHNFICILLGLLASLFAFVGCEETDSVPPVLYQVSFTVDGEVYATVDTAGEEKITLPEAPTKEGYIFEGWYFDAETWTAELTQDTLSGRSLESNITVYAKWTEEGYLSELLQGTSLQVDGMQKTGDYEYSLSVFNDTKALDVTKMLETNSQTKWTLYADAECTQALTNAKKVSLNEGDNKIYVKVTASNGDTQVYLLQVRRMPFYSVAFIVDNTLVKMQTVAEGKTVEFPLVSKRGYTLLGWTWASYDGDISIEIPEDVESPTVNLPGDIPTEDTQPDVETPPTDDEEYLEVFFDFSTPITESGILTAVWEPNAYTVTLNANGGTVNANSVTAYYEQVLALSTPTRTGYIFDGWYLNEEKFAEGAWNLEKDITLTAKWSLEWYTISYELNGGNAENPISYSVESEDIVLNTPVKEGCQFMGWALEEDGELVASVTIPKGSIGARKYTAVWDWNGYIVTYELDGGTNDTLNPSRYETTDENIRLYAPTKEGYVFGGWYTDATFQTEIDCILQGSSKDLTLYAKWTAITYTMQFDKNAFNARGEMETQTLERDKSAVLSYNQFVLDGYTFTGWNTTADGSGTAYANGATVLNLTAEHGAVVTLYAQWAIRTITVSFYRNGGVGGPAMLTAKVGEKLATESLTAPTKVGYDFTGYYDALGVKYVDSNMVCVKAWDKDNDALYAGWKGHNYTVRFEANGGVGEMGAQDFVYGVLEQLRENTFRKTGYAFQGWRTDIDGVCVCGDVDCNPAYCYCDEDCICKAQGGECDVIVNMEEVAGLTPVEGEVVTLYATWAPVWMEVQLNTMAKNNEYFVRFHPNGGHGSAPDTQKVTRYSPLYYPDAPTRNGYVFVGWYDNPELTGEAFDFSATVTQDLTLYAKWIAVEEGISFLPTANYTYLTCYSEVTLYAFMPLKSGNFTFYGYDIYNGNTLLLYLYDADKNALNYNYSYELSAYLTEGTLYYFGVASPNGYGETQAYLYLDGDNQPVDGGYAANGYLDSNWIEYLEESYAFTMPSKEGYAFQGWYDGEGGTGTQYTDANGNGIRQWDKYVVTTLYAKWKLNEYTVHYEANGGVGEDIPDQEFAYFEPQTLRDNGYTRYGYTFEGWSLNADGTGVVYACGEEVSNLTQVDGDTVTLYAVWRPISVNVSLSGLPQEWVVSFDLQGGDGWIPSQAVTSEVGLQYPDIPTRSGYVFAGWYDNADCMGSPYDFTAEIFEDVTLYAKWNYLTETYYSVIYVGDNTGEIFVSTEQRFAFVPLVSGEIRIYTTHTSGDPYLRMYNSANMELAYDDDSYGNRDALITYTVEAGQTYYVGFSGYNNSSCNGCMYIEGARTPADGGLGLGGLEYLRSVAYDSTPTFATPNVDYGYAFVGWYDGENGTGRRYTDGNGTCLVPWDTLQDVTLHPYIRWVEYSVEFHANGADGLSITQPFVYGSGQYLYGLAYERMGYTFAGWNTQADGSGTWYADGEYVNNLTQEYGEIITLYAQWTREEYTITYYHNYDIEVPNVPSITNDTAYPWTEVDGVLQSTNHGRNTSSVYTITATRTMSISFTYRVSSEDNYDKLRIEKNGTEIDTISGSVTKTYSDTLYAGDILTFTYSKDGSVDRDEDSAYIENLTYSTYLAPLVTTVTYNVETPTFALMTPTREGYAFEGWFTEETFENQVTEISIGSYGDKVYYAKWS